VLANVSLPEHRRSQQITKLDYFCDPSLSAMPETMSDMRSLKAITESAVDLTRFAVICDI